MSLGMGCRLVIGLRCTVCHELMDSEKKTESLIIAALFGAEKYAICSGCSQEVDRETFGDRNYRQRWTRKLKSLTSST